MTRKCPPGVICFENITLVIFIGIALIVLYLAYTQYSKNDTNNKNENTYNNYKDISEYKINMGSGMGMGMGGGFQDLIPRIGSGYTRGPADVLLNPYTPPLRDDRYFNTIGLSTNMMGGIAGNMGGDVRGGIPINVPTRSVNAAYRQVGILTRVNGPETILSLMGRPLFPSQDKWQFYTMSDKNQSVKLPVTYKKRSCTSDLGCDNIYNGDTVYVEGYNDAFKATIYDTAIQYSIPYF
jgi:hypothetical protein